MLASLGTDEKVSIHIPGHHRQAFGGKLRPRCYLSRSS